MEYKLFNWRTAVSATIAAFTTAILLRSCNPYLEVSKVSQVAKGYVIPAEIEQISVEDLNKDGKLEETIIKYKGKALLFKETANGGVEGVPFDVTEKRY